MPHPEIAHPPVSDGDVIAEKLPYPVVYYPGLHGTFFAFARDRRATPVMCECSRAPAENLLRLRPQLRRPPANGAAHHAAFPAAIAWRLERSSLRAGFPVEFVPGLCHICNGTQPALHFCDALCGSDFLQAYGWYVSQAYLRAGVMPNRYEYLQDVCPDTYRTELDAARDAEAAFTGVCDCLLEGAFAQEAVSSPEGPTERLRRLCEQDAQRIAELRQRASEARQGIKARFERVVRGAVGT